MYNMNSVVGQGNTCNEESLMGLIKPKSILVHGLPTATARFTSRDIAEINFSY